MEAVAVMLYGAVAALLVALVILTAAGGRHRGGSWLLAIAGGLLFPITWVAWHLSDRRH